MADFAGDELESAPRTLVIEQDAGAGEQIVALAVIDGDVVTVDLGHAVRAARMKRRRLALRRLAGAAEHLAAASLIESGVRTDLPEGVQQPRHTQCSEFRRQHWLLPAR